MAKPTDMDRIWASAAPTTNIVARGNVKWEEGFSAEIPHFQELNELFNRLTAGYSLTASSGCLPWDEDTAYPISGKCLHGDKRWVSTTPNSGIEPGTSVDWSLDDGHSIGDIIMFDANTPATIDGISPSYGASGEWVDNVTKPGWYSCTALNASYGVPNLINKFVRGSDAGSAGVFSGSDSIELTESNIPSHTHALNVELDAEGSEHTHDFSRITNIAQVLGQIPLTGTIVLPKTGTATRIIPAVLFTDRYQQWTINQLDTTDYDHSHNVTGDTESSGSSESTPVDLSKYSVIFIKKVL